MAETRAFRSFKTAEVVLAFARQGIATDTIARALVVGCAQTEAICRRAVETGELLCMPPQSPADVRGAMAAELTHLRAELANVRALIREIRNVADADALSMTGVARLTPSEATIVSALVSQGRVSAQRLYHLLYGHRLDTDAPEPEIVKVLVSKARKKLRAIDMQIVTVWGWGYDMSVEHRDALKALALANRQAPLPLIDSPPLAPVTAVTA